MREKGEEKKRADPRGMPARPENDQRVALHRGMHGFSAKRRYGMAIEENSTMEEQR